MPVEPGNAQLVSKARPEIARRRMRRRITWIVIIVAIAAGFFYLRVRGKAVRAMMEAGRWETKIVEATDVEVVVSEIGTVEPLSQVLVKSEVAAAVKDILVEEGDSVTKGQVVALLDDSRILQRVEEAAAQLDAAAAGVRQSQLSRSQAEGTSSAGLVSARASIDAARAALSIAQEGRRPEEIEQAEQQLAQAQAELASGRARLAELQTGPRALEVAEQEENVRQAEAQLARAQAALAEAEAGSRPQEIAEAQAALAQARAAEQSAAATLEKLRRGNRPQEIAQAEASVEQAIAKRDEAKATYERQKELRASGYVSDQSVDTARASYLSAEAALASQKQALGLAREGPRGEDVIAAEAELERARGGVAAARERLSLVEAGQRSERIEDARQAVAAASAQLSAQRSRLALLREGTRSEQVEQQVSAVRRLEAAVSAAEAALRLARIGSRPQEIDQAAASLREAEAGLSRAMAQGLDPAIRSEDIVKAQAQVNSARTALVRAQEDLDDCTITSPMDGVVLKRHIEPGELAMSGTTGFSEGTVLLTIGDVSALVVTLQVHEVDVINLRTGLAADVRLDAIPEETFAGEVFEIAPQSTVAGQQQAAGRAAAGAATGGVATYRVRVKLTQHDPRILAGMSARVKVVCDRAEGVPAVTLAALRSEEDTTYVFVPGPTPTAKPEHRAVTLGLRGQSMVEIKSGIEIGERYLVKRPKTEFDIGPPEERR